MDRVVRDYKLFSRVNQGLLGKLPLLLPLFFLSYFILGPNPSLRESEIETKRLRQ
jgi:hypothetical protein